MANLDNLIKDIREDEVVDIKGSLDAAAEWRIEEKILKGIRNESEDDVIVTKLVEYKKLNRRKWLILAAAVIVVLTMGVTSAAKNEWDIALIDFMGLSDANTLQLEGGEVQIDQSSSFGNLQMRVVSSIGDKNSAYIRIETNYEFPEDYNMETDYILPWSHSLTISDGQNHNTKDFAATWMYYPEDGKLCYLVSISNCENLNKSRIQLKVKDLYIHHDLNDPESDAEEELLMEGEWSFDWTYHYKSNANEYRMLKSFENQGVTYYLTKVEISPISVRMEAFCMPQDRNQIRPTDLIQKITYKDGTYVEITSDSSGGVRDGMFVNSFVDVGMTGETIRSNEVKSITISGTEIALN